MTAHPAVSRTWATLRIWAESLDPEDVTLHLGVSPSESWKAGERFGREGRNIRKHGRWALTSEDNFVSNDLEEHIIWIIEQIEPAHEQLAELLDQPGMCADLFCFWESGDANAGIVFSSTLMGRASALNLSIGLDIYFGF